MKRLLAFLFVSVVAFGFIPFGSDQKLFSNPEISKICMISTQEYQDEGFSQVIQNGGQYYYFTQSPAAAKKVKDYDGIVLYFENSAFEDVVKFYKISYFQGKNVENYAIFYGFTTVCIIIPINK